VEAMTQKWYSVIRITRPDGEQVVVEVTVPSDSPWFSGHFPDRPILPGIAQLDMARDVVRELKRSDFRVYGLKKVRFRQMIRPDDAITVTARRREETPASYSFRIMAKDQLACSGILIASE
jgi:3-hydroxyacyl-[acyl-carrier-protein] dehydratase